MHRVELHAEPALDHGADGVEVEQALHQFGIIGNGIEDDDLGVADPCGADRVDIDIGHIGDPVLVDHLGAGEDRLGDLFRRRSAIADIVFDAEIFIRPAGIVAGRKHHAAESLVFADHVGGCRRRKNAALTHHDAAKTVGGGNLDQLLDHFAIVIATVAADHERLAGKTFQHIEDRLDEVFSVVLLLEHRNLLAQARSARLLILVWGGRDCRYGHVFPG